MSSQLQIVTKLNPQGCWEIVASILPGGTLPQDIFIYENTGTNILGAYQGVCQLDEYQRFQTFTGSPIPIFSNRYVKYTQGQLKLDIGVTTTQAISVITNEVTSLSTQFNSAAQTTTVITITP